ncbi:unnamed protein product [Rotaria magnacalcarata]
MQRFSKILIDARINEVTANEIKQALISSEQKALKASIGHLTENFDNLPIPDFVNTSQQTINLRSTNTVDTYSNTNNNSYSTRKQSNYDASRFQSIVSKNLNGNSRHVEMYDQASAIFSHFLIRKAFARKDDPFLTGFREMIAEETYSCTSRAPNDFNRLLLQELSDIGNKYKQETQTMKSVDASIDLPAIYELISIMSAIRLVHEQLVAVKRRHRMTIEQYDIMYSLLFIYQFKMHQQFYNVNYYLLEKQNRSINLFYQSDPI